MTVKGFSRTEALRFGWTTVKNNFIFFIGGFVIAGLVLCVFDFVVESTVLYFLNRFGECGMLYSSDFVPESAIWDVSNFIAELLVTEQSDIWHVSDFIAGLLGGISVLAIVSTIAFLLLCILIRMWIIRISLRFCDNERGKYSDIFSCFTLYIRVLLSCLLYLLVVFLGICLFLIPGIIWAIKFRFFTYFIIDKGLTPIKAFKKSWVITTGVKWRLLVLFMVLGLVNVLGALCFGIGLFATIPTTMLAMTFVYRRLLSQAEVATKFETLHQLTRKRVVSLLILLGMFLLYSYIVLYPEVETSCIDHVGFGRHVVVFNSDGGYIQWVPEENPVELKPEEHARWIRKIKKLCREDGYHYWYNAFFDRMNNVACGFIATVVIGCAIVFLKSNHAIGCPELFTPLVVIHCLTYLLAQSSGNLYKKKPRAILQSWIEQKNYLGSDSFSLSYNWSNNLLFFHNDARANISKP